VLPILLVSVMLTACAPPEEPPAPGSAVVSEHRAGTTPEETLKKFIESQRSGDLEATKATLYPGDAEFRLDRAVVIRTYQILGKKVLTAAEAAEYTSSPPRQEGDVVLEVYEEYEKGRTSNVTYFMRELHGEWRIYSLSFTL
jgi:hypothetical protein